MSVLDPQLTLQLTLMSLPVSACCYSQIETLEVIQQHIAQEHDEESIVHKLKEWLKHFDVCTDGWSNAKVVQEFRLWVVGRDFDPPPYQPSSGHDLDPPPYQPSSRVAI